LFFEKASVIRLCRSYSWPPPTPGIFGSGDTERDRPTNRPTNRPTDQQLRSLRVLGEP